jgi:homoserine O-acetyltransferase
MEEHKIFQFDAPFTLESGSTIPVYRLAYHTLGQLNENKSNAIWVFHALTGSSEVADWWDGLVGKGKLFDPARYFIICVNMPGSCYGSTGPLNIDPVTGNPWYHRFPFFTPRDMARSYVPLCAALGIEKIQVGIGGSMGGQQLLEWAIEEPERFASIIPIATNAVHSAWGRAFNASQRMCIENDVTWKEAHPAAGLKGMEIARGIGLISYRHYETYAKTQSDSDGIEGFRAESYQRYQGEKLSKRFNAFSYYVLSKGMDAHNVGRNRGGVETALQRIKARTLSIGVSTDVLFPPSEQLFIGQQIPGAETAIIDSLYGHDGFLLEYAQLEKIIGTFINDQN